MINSSNLINKNEQRFRSLALLTVIVIYLLILAGGIVRGTGSGMGCPDWPKCFGRWIPPTEASQLPLNYQEIYGAKLKGEVEFNAVKTWIEYVNRLLGVLSGFFVLATVVASISYLKKDKAVFLGSFAAFLLIGLNGWLGSRVVATELAQYMITLHLLLAVLVVFSLIFVLIRSYSFQLESASGQLKTARINGLLLTALFISLSQVLLGTQVRDALDEVVKRLGQSQRNSWIDNIDWRFYIHRSYSLVVLFVQVVISYRLYKLGVKGLINTLAKMIVAVTIAEIITGAVMAYFGVPAIAQPIHLLLAVVMIGLQFAVWVIQQPKLMGSNQALEESRLLNV
ncbi:heme A synthase [Spirosoma soli]|uniref:Heme A synthase n=1 Tax=Spirosoma soli TaxID=1770529 RepID=A0ABW5M711_9BACT